MWIEENQLQWTDSFYVYVPGTWTTAHKILYLQCIANTTLYWPILYKVPHTSETVIILCMYQNDSEVQLIQSMLFYYD